MFRIEEIQTKYFTRDLPKCLKGTERSLTPTPDIITFMHLSIMECNGGLTIVVTEWQHGEKIILTSDHSGLLQTGN